MLDAFKSKSGASKLQSDELQTLIAASREERAALSTMLTQVQLHSAKLVVGQQDAPGGRGEGGQGAHAGSTR